MLLRRRSLSLLFVLVIQGAVAVRALADERAAEFAALCDGSRS